VNIKEIIHTALENLDATLLKGEWHPFEKGAKQPDGQLTLVFEDQTVRFDAIVKNEVRTYQMRYISYCLSYPSAFVH